MQAIPLVLMAVGTAASTYGTYQQGQATQDELRTNARYTEMNAAMEAGKLRREFEARSGVTRRTLGTITPMFAANGVSLASGTAEDIYRDSAVQLELEARNAQYDQNQVSVTGAASAKSMRIAGGNAANSATWGAGGQLLTGIGSMYGTYSTNLKTGTSSRSPAMAKKAPASGRGTFSPTLMTLSSN